MFQSLLIKDVNILELHSGEMNRRDIYIADGRIMEIAPKISREAQYIVKADGLIAVPGLVDVHSHLYYDTELIGVDPQRYDLPNGVTYCIDQGSAGADNYYDFRERVLLSTDVRVRSFLNCSRIGMPVSSLAETGEQPGPGELAEKEYFDKEMFIREYKKYEDELLGIKIRLTPNICPEKPLEALKKAVGIAEELGVRVSVHGNHARGLMIEDILSVLRKGDIFTHTFHRGVTGILDVNGRIKKCVLEARDRGVIFDTGHGVNSLSFEVMTKALKQGFSPDTISTDLHNLNVDGPVYDMPTTISKFLCRDMPLHEAFQRCITNPVKLLGLTDKVAEICVGSTADIAVFELKKGKFIYRDAVKDVIGGQYKLEARYTILGNKMFR